MTLFFAYGANLDPTDRDAWIRIHSGGRGRITLVAPALLLDRRLGFERFNPARGGGVVTLGVAPGHVTDGVLFELNEAALDALDAREGHPYGYVREPVHAILPDGRVVEAQTYDVPPDRRIQHTPPTNIYHSLVRRGLEAHGLDAAALDRAASGEAPVSEVPWLFVYGTLREGLPNAHLLNGLPREPATCPGDLHDCGSYPGMALGSGSVTGELVPLDTTRLPALDALEEARPFGAPGGTYRRTVLTAARPDGTTERAQLYIMEDPRSFPMVASGDWLTVGDRRAAWRARQHA